MYRDHRRTALLFTLLLASVSMLAAAPQAVADHPMSFKWVDEGRVAVGDGRLTGSDAQALKARGIGAVLNLIGGDGGDDVPAMKESGLTYRHLAVTRPEEIDYVTLLDGLAWVKQEVDAGRPVFIHCEVVNRTSVFTVAYLMEREHLRLEEAKQVLAARGVAFNIWDPEILLRFEAKLFNEAKLGLFLSSQRAIASPGDEIPVKATVKGADGALLAGADVRVRSGVGAPVDLVTAADGTASFTWRVAPGDCWDNQCFLEVRARKAGFIDSVQRAIVPRPEYGALSSPHLEAPATQLHAIENGAFPIAFNLRGTLGLAVPVEVIGPDGMYARTVTGGGWDQVDLPVAAAWTGPLTVTLKAHKFGYGEITRQVTLTVDASRTGSVGGLFNEPPEDTTGPKEEGSFLQLFTGPVKWLGLVLLAGAIAVAVVAARRGAPPAQ